MFAREGFVAYAAWPLVSQGRVLGALQIFHRSELTLDAEASGFVTCLAAMSAVAIQIATLEQEWHDRPCAGERGAAVDFSPVEWRVLQLVVEGWTNEEIGAQVHLSASTIKSHVRRILDKSGATNRTNLARRATREGWV
jgi:DNA-binding NarL/FixJ family response regulator